MAVVVWGKNKNWETEKRRKCERKKRKDKEGVVEAKRAKEMQKGPKANC